MQIIALILLCGAAVGQGRPTICDEKGNCYAVRITQSRPDDLKPFDVPPVHIVPKCEGGCVPAPDYWTCADSRRTLLHSEDGKGHCYAFYQLQEK